MKTRPGDMVVIKAIPRGMLRERVRAGLANAWQNGKSLLGLTAAHMRDKRFGRLVRSFVCWRRVKRGPLGATTLKDCAVE